MQHFSTSVINKMVSVPLLASVLVACGGSGGEEEAQTSAPQTAQVQAMATVTGRAVKGVIENGLVNAYQIENNAGRYEQASNAVSLPARTDANGYYEISVPAQLVGQQLMIEITADEQTRMVCEIVSGCSEQTISSFGDTFALGESFKLSNITAPISMERPVEAHVTAFTHMARVLAERSLDGFSEDSISLARADIEAMLELEQGVLALAPIDITDATELSSANSDQVELAFLSAALQAIAGEAGFDGVSDVVSNIEERLQAQDGLALSDNGLDATVALDDLFYHAQTQLNDVDQNYSILSSQVVSQLDAEYSDAQQRVMDEASVVDPVQILAQPSGASLSAGEAFTLSVGVIGGAPISFQWFLDDLAIVGETGSSLTVTNAQPAQSGTYKVKVSNAVGSVTSELASVDVTAITRDVSLSWDIPTEREDGSALALFEIDGYVIQFGSSANSMDNSVSVAGASVTDYTINDLLQGGYYFAIATVDSDGVQGSFSDPIEFIVN